MNDRAHRQAIDRDRIHRDAESGDAKTIAEIETSAAATLRQVHDKKAELIEAGDLSEQGISNVISGMIDGWYTARADLSAQLDAIEAKAKAVGDAMPERKDEHDKLCDLYRDAPPDRKMRHITDALSGKNDELAVALLTEHAMTNQLNDIDRANLRKRIAVGADQLQRDDLLSRIAAARRSLEYVTAKLTGV